MPPIYSICSLLVGETIMNINYNVQVKLQTVSVTLLPDVLTSVEFKSPFCTTSDTVGTIDILSYDQNTIRGKESTGSEKTKMNYF